MTKITVQIILMIIFINKQVIDYFEQNHDYRYTILDFLEYYLADIILYLSFNCVIMIIIYYN